MRQSVGYYSREAAVNNNKVRKPLETLERMRARRETQVAFNQRIMKNSELVSGMNSGLADFLRGFDVRPAIPVYVCVTLQIR
jgi:hypothetical protein